MQDRPKKILLWRESLNKLPDTHFFDLMRMYLGEIKTPYNKQKLIERLSSFLRQDVVRNLIVELLSEEESLILSAIKFLPSATLIKLVGFFEHDFSQRELREILMNLEERLLIFRSITETGNELYEINPLLIEVLEKVCKKDFLFKSFSPELIHKLKKNETSFLETTQTPPINALFIASWISFIAGQSEMQKTDGSYKKKTELEIEHIFPDFTGKNKKFLQTLTKALENLDLVKVQRTSLKADFVKLRTFAEMDEITQRAYIVAGSIGYYSLQTLENITKLVLNIHASVPQMCTESTLYRCAFFIQEQMGTSIKKSRIASLIEKQRSLQNESKIEKKEFDIHMLIKNMFHFGMLRKEKGSITAIDFVKTNERGFVRMDAGFEVTVMPPYTLKELIPLVQFVRISRFDTALSFEMTRYSCYSAFADGLSPNEIKKILENLTSHPVSQSVLFSLDEWFESFSAVSVYRGYVLKIAPEKRRIVEESGVFSEHIVQKLAEGVYILDFYDDEEMYEVFKKSGLPFNGISNSKTATLTSTKKIVEVQGETFDFSSSKKNDFSYNKNVKERQKYLFEELKKKNYSKAEQEALFSRIERKIVLLPEQLVAQSVRFEKTEAVGMDFLGKIQVVEAAMATDNLIEITKETTYGKEKKEEVIRGVPTFIEKQEGNALVHILFEDTNERKIFSVGKAAKIKRIRGSIFQNRI